MSEDRHTIVLIESYWEGYFQSIAWIAVLSASMGLAVWLESTAMQWVMAGFWLLSLIGWVSGRAKRLPPDQAIARIEEIKAARPSGEVTA